MTNLFKRVLSRYFLVLLVWICPDLSFADEYTFQLDSVRIVDLTRIIYGDVLHRPFILDDEFLRSPDLVTVSWVRSHKSNLDSLMMELLSRRGFETDKIGKIMLVRRRLDEDKGVLIYEPKHRSAKYLADILLKVAGAQQLGSRGMTASPAFQLAAQKKDDSGGSALGQFDRSAPDQLAFACYLKQCDRLRGLLDQIDTVQAQVMLRAAVYEVGISKGEGSAVQIAGELLGGKLSFSIGSTLAGADQIKFSAGGLDAVLSVLDQDSRFKVVSRPMLRVRTGEQARFSVGQQVPVLGAIAQDKNGNFQQSIEYRQSGTIFTVRPDIHQDVIDLDINQELSSFVNTTTGVNNSPTLLQRTASSQLSIKPGEVVVFAGLEEIREAQAKTGFFGFTTSKKNSKAGSEVLLFIEATPI